MDATVGDLVAALEYQHRELDEILADLDEADWPRPTPCPGWAIVDVVTHLAQTDRLTRASLHDEFGPVGDDMLGGSMIELPDVDAVADGMVRRERGVTGPTVRHRWRAGAEALRQDLLTAQDGHRRYAWFRGTMSLRTLASTRLAEAWIHTGDVARAVGVSQTPTGHLCHIARLAWRTLPYAFRKAGRAMTGPVAFELTAPDGGLWMFVPADSPPLTLISGNALDLCRVAARRVHAEETSLHGDGPDAEAVLALVRTYA